MKILLTLFVLFFSSSIYAGDNLGGKKIFCSKETDYNAILIGFSFTNSSEVIIYKETINIPLRKITHKYKTSAVKIHITDYIKTGTKYYIIYRKTLAVAPQGYTSSLWDFNEGDCELIEGSIVELFNEYLKHFKKDNKI